MLEGTKVNSTKTIHSRSNKDIGDVIEGEWEITAKRVIAEPRPGDGNGPPRFGIYEYAGEGHPYCSAREANARQAAERAEHRRNPARSVIGSPHRAKNVLTRFEGAPLLLRL